MFRETGETRALKKAAAQLLTNSSANAPPAIVYHYTSLDTAAKILDSFQIWCTNAAYSTDTTEGVYGQSVIDRICTQDRDLLMEGARRLVAEEIDGYTASFCAKPDEPSQWQKYGAKGHGVAIGVDVATLSSRSNVAFSHVEYTPERQERLVKDVLNLFRARLLSARSWPPRKRLLSSVLTLSFVIVRAMLKDPFYHTELEYRLLDALRRDARHHDTPLEYFPRGSRSVPFFRVDLRESTAACATQPIREVWIGPCLDGAAAEARLKGTAAYRAQPFSLEHSRVHMANEPRLST